MLSFNIKELGCIPNWDLMDTTTMRFIYGDSFTSYAGSLLSECFHRVRLDVTREKWEEKSSV